MRLRRLSIPAKCIVTLSGLFAFIFYGIVASWYFIGINLTDEKFLGVDKCPACYGNSICSILQDSQIELSGMSKFSFSIFDLVNIKHNVHFGYHKNTGDKLVIKKLGQNFEIQAVDDWICDQANRPRGCDVARLMHKTQVGTDMLKNGLKLDHIKGMNYMFSCATYRLLDRVITHYKEQLSPDPGTFSLPDKLQLYITAKINQEPLMLQTFPYEEGWPFPKYYGACGRYIVQSYAGRPLSNFYYSSFEERADIAYQILKIAQRFTENEDKYALYWTDLKWENFSVDDTGMVTVIDAEHIIVVDKEAIEQLKPEGWNEFHQSEFDDCEQDCSTFTDKTMCKHLYNDHNYYAACRHIFGKYTTGFLKELMTGYQGLLHDIPEHTEEVYDLTHLITECIHPEQLGGRFMVKEKLIRALANIRTPKESLNSENNY